MGGGGGGGGGGGDSILNPAQCWGQGTTPGLGWGGRGLVVVSISIRLAGMKAVSI